MWILGVLDFGSATTRNSLRNETNEAKDVALLLLVCTKQKVYQIFGL